jgi:hypothetical protein
MWVCDIWRLESWIGGALESEEVGIKSVIVVDELVAGTEMQSKSTVKAHDTRYLYWLYA